MQDMRVLKNPTSLSSWRAWEREAYQRSGFVAIAAGLFAPLTFAFAIFPSLLASTPARTSVPIFLVALILYLAALEAVPVDYIEAAQVDGASGWQIIRSIRWPLITPTFFFVLVTTVIAVNDEVFGAINVLTDGGPFNKTSNIVYYLYLQGFRFFQIGTASAVSLIIFVGTVLLTWLQFRFVERHVHYG